MRITLLIGFVLSVTLQFALASNVRGQAMGDVKVNITLENESLVEAIKKIEKESPFRFLYRASDISNINNLNINASSISVDDLLKVLLKGLPLSIKQVDDRILITRREAAYNTLPRLIREGLQKDTLISGTVYDAKTKDRIIGATVLVKGGTARTQTDSKGNFKLVTSRNAVLLISYIGYETKEVTVTNPVLEIRLEESAQSLKAVVVTGIVNQSKSTFTGAARTFNAQELSKVSNNNVLSALTSLDPSFRIPENLLTGSNPNVLPDVVLRGGNTLVDIRQDGNTDPFNYNNKPNSPLFILDGFETTLQRINDLDMNRIASVTILKDAGATAIYGSRGANGVIVIELSRPVEGELRFTYSASTSIEASDLTGYDLLNAKEKFDLEDRTGVFINNLIAGKMNLII